MKQVLFSVLILFALLSYSNIYSQTFENGYYRLTTKWLGKGKALDVVNDGQNDQLTLASVENVSGQLWRFTPMGNGYYRLTNQWQGEEKALDIVNDGTNNHLQMANTTNVTGQLWKFTPLGNGYYRLTNKWLGDGKSLDVLNDDTGSYLQMANTESVGGQFWKMELIYSLEEDTEETEAKLEDFKAVLLHGFKVMVKKGTEKEEKTKKIMSILSEKLEEVTKALKPKPLNFLKTIPIWLEFKKYGKALAWCHISEGWLVNNGYPAQMVNSIEVCDIQNFIDFQQDQPYNVILHELGHAYHHSLSEELKEKIAAAYNNALKSKKYEQVEDFQGEIVRHYALDNEGEYFAELTVAFFGRGYYIPFTRQELKTFDPIGYRLMQEVWE
ncbi:RICIN domain-containing protein [Thermoflexibacter ruber]|uniref:Ricin-type beta-trefoil lectin domain-like n=1 Tax=Thermoflexibacter ruber TaxID=1003 RepID=A0A1I2G1C1_9BACT|nr:RICIN domain-containing protein [Thermoflexibacter ruber]SFF10760.1 Ricin-type beta-trefoil lectin domain-like [Thermoflexibacter ruber]